jgi:hypothetical protein
MAFGQQYCPKSLKPEAEKWRLDRGVKEFLCARALFTYCKYVLFRIYDTESTDRVFLRYRYGNYREIPTDTDRKIPTWYTSLDFSVTVVQTEKPLTKTLASRGLEEPLPGLHDQSEFSYVTQ